MHYNSRRFHRILHSIATDLPGCRSVALSSKEVYPSSPIHMTTAAGPEEIPEPVRCPPSRAAARMRSVYARRKRHWYHSPQQRLGHYRATKASLSRPARRNRDPRGPHLTRLLSWASRPAPITNPTRVSSAPNARARPPVPPAPPGAAATMPPFSPGPPFSAKIALNDSSRTTAMPAVP